MSQTQGADPGGSAASARPEGAPGEAERAFLEYLRAVEAGEKVDFAAFAAARPALEVELFALHAEWRRVTDLLERLDPPASLSSRLRARYGESVDPGVSLSGDGEPAAPGAEAEEAAGILEGLFARRRDQTRYRPRREIARGGMGAVLEVWDEDLRRVLAMKVILSRSKGGSSEGDGVDTRRLARFLEEAQITGQLDHPGIVPVHELGIDREGRLFFTMRKVEGRDLREVFELAARGREGWTRTRLLNVLLRVCEAMAYAHSKGVVHRDLKPANIMVGRFGETYVMDWGLAKVLGRPDVHDLRLAEDVRGMERQGATDTAERRVVTVRSDTPDGSGSPLVTMDGDVVGTPAYMPPEQALGKLDEIGPRSDVYSVGAMLYHLLAGHMPYEPLGAKAGAHVILEAVRQGPPWPLSKIDPELPAELVAICEKAMARDPLERYPDMLAMAEDLRAYLEGRVVQAYETGVFAEAKKWVQRNRIAAAALLALLLTGLVSAAAFVLQQQTSLRRLAEEQARTARAAREAQEAAAQLAAKQDELREQSRRADEQAREARRSAREAAYNARRAEEQAEAALRQSYRAGIQAAQYSLRLAEVRPALRALEGLDESLRGFEWGHLALRLDSAVERFVGVTGGSRAAAFSGDGRRLVYAGRSLPVRLVDLATGEDEPFPIPPVGALFGGVGVRGVFALAPDGATAAVAEEPGIRLWNAVGRIPLHALRPKESERAGALTALRFSPQYGRRLVSADDAGIVRVWEPLTGRAVLTLAAHEGAARVAAIRLDERFLATGGDDRVVRVFSATTGELAAELRGHLRPITDLDWSPDGSLLASASSDGLVVLWDVARAAKHAELRGHVGAVRAVRFSPRGDRVYTGGEDATVRAWSPRTGEQEQVLFGHRGTVLDLVGLDDGRVRSVGGEGDVRTFDPRWDAAVEEMRAAGGVLALGHDAARERVVAWTAEGGVREWAPESGLLERVWPPPDDLPERGGAATVAPDGRAAAYLSAGEEIVLVDLAGEPAAVRFPAGSRTVRRLALSAGGRHVAAVGLDRVLRLFARDHPGEVRLEVPLEVRSVDALALDDAGDTVVLAARDRTLIVVDAHSGEVRARLRTGHERRVTALAVANGAGGIASGDSGGGLLVRDLDGGEELRLEGHEDAVTALAFSARGDRLASGSRDRSVRVWDPRAGGELLALTGHAGPIAAVRFAEDQRLLLSGDDLGIVRAWWTGDAPERYARRRRAREVRERAEERVDRLLARVLWVPLALPLLEADRGSDPEVAEDALRVAWIRHHDPAFQAEQVYEVALDRAVGAEAIEAAIEHARRAVRLRAALPETAGALGAALARAGRYEEALGHLDAAIGAREARGASPDPRDLGFRALAEAALGREVDARLDLASLIEVARTAPPERRLAAFRLAAEVEDLLAGNVEEEDAGEGDGR